MTLEEERETRQAFAAARAAGLVSFTVEPDDSPDLSFLDQECFADIRAEQLARANTEGTWGIVVRVAGESIGSVWGFIGDDWRDSGYDTDLMREALDRIAPTPSHWCAL